MTVFPVPDLACADGNELRQIVIERAEAIVHPGAEGWKLSIEHVASGMELGLGTVIAICGPHRTDEGNTVHVSSGMREPVAHFNAALPVFFEADLERVK